MDSNNKLTEKLKRVKMLVMDVDGTLTDGSMYYSSEGEVLKRFNVRDGMSFHLMEHGGIIPAFLTSENNPITIARAKKLNVKIVVLGSRNKTEDVQRIAEQNNLSLDEIAYIGDDVNDLNAMKIIGVSACPNDSVTAVREFVDYVCKADGGRGAVREFTELILLSQNKSIILKENW